MYNQAISLNDNQHGCEPLIQYKNTALSFKQKLYKKGKIESYTWTPALDGYFKEFNGTSHDKNLLFMLLTFSFTP